MTRKWIHAGGEYQLPFLGAANRALHGDPGPCPRCKTELHVYFHAFYPDTGTGSIWLWCGTCGSFVTLPRVKPTLRFPDPFVSVPRGEFGSLEAGTEEVFHDRLERLWQAGELFWPK